MNWRRFVPFLPKPTPKRNVMRCSKCQRPIHKRERYVIREVEHKDCSDPKLIGQLSLPTREEP